MLGLLGFPVAASLAAAPYYLPLFAPLAWVLAASLLLCFRKGAAGEDYPSPRSASGRQR
jgi:hypothetical protein